VVTELPKSCSLSPAEGAARAAEPRALARGALRSRERDEGSVLLRFNADPGVADAVADVARRERECCPFLDLHVAEEPGSVTLSISAAREDRAALDAFYELAAG
jgi:hypothetical protein